LIRLTSADELEDILSEVHPTWWRVLAARSALRVLPIALTAGLPESVWLPAFRACFVSWAASRLSAHNLTLPAQSAAAAAVRAAGATGGFIGLSVKAAANAVQSVVRDGGSHTVEAVTYAADSVGQYTTSVSEYSIWEAMGADLTWVLTELSRQPEHLALLQLWYDETPQWANRTWRGFSQNLRALNKLYRPWINWYEFLITKNGLNSDYFGPELTLRIAKQPDEWWSRPSELVNADIDEWLRQRDEERIHIPEPEPGINLGIAEDGRIGIVPTGAPSPEERQQLDELLEVLGEKADELAEALTGSNAFAPLLKDVRKYAEVLRQQTLSIDRLYARGNVLENTRAYLQKDIDAGNLPEMALEIAAGLDSILAMHAPLIALTGRGQQLLESSHLYESKAADISASRLAAREFANAVARSDRLFTDEVREEWPVMADSIGEGRYSERSSQLAMVGNKNVMIALAILVATPVVESAVTASIPGALAVGSLKGTIDAAWLFMISYLPVITNLVQVSGPSLAWMKPVLRLVSRGRG